MTILLLILIKILKTYILVTLIKLYFYCKEYKYNFYKFFKSLTSTSSYWIIKKKKKIDLAILNP